MTNWTLHYRDPGGHKLFTCEAEPGPSGLYIADRSGYTPDDTDDGPLRFDLRHGTGEIRVDLDKRRDGGSGRSTMLPVVHADTGDRTNITASPRLVVAIAAYFGIPVRMTFGGLEWTPPSPSEPHTVSEPLTTERIRERAAAIAAASPGISHSLETIERYTLRLFQDVLGLYATDRTEAGDPARAALEAVR